MNIEQFFKLFLKELEDHPTLWHYYKFHSDKNGLAFRKAYFCQRLEYISKNILNKESKIWDIGCGYGTTALFLALNGYKVHGTTLEFYFKEIPQRIKYWSQYGDVSGFTYGYEDLFDEHAQQPTFDCIIVQDTLHHLEPLNKALEIINDHLNHDGTIISIEENGSNIVQSLKLYKQRGNKRIIEFYDERLQKKILLGNENIRPLSTWKKEFGKFNLKIEDNSIHYVRAFPPVLFNYWGYDLAIEKEQLLARNSNLAKKYLFFGINFVAKKLH